MIRMANQANIRVTSTIIGLRPSGRISATHPVVQLAKQSLQSLGIEASLSVGSTDANIPLSLGIPAVCIALTKGSGAHSSQEFIYTKPLEQGMKQLHALVEGLLTYR
jgi:di/tripeptidase